MASPRLGESEAIRGQSHSPSQRDASLSSIEISGLRPVAAGVVCGSGSFLEIAPEVPRAVRFLDWSASWCCRLEKTLFWSRSVDHDRPPNRTAMVWCTRMSALPWELTIKRGEHVARRGGSCDGLEQANCVQSLSGGTAQPCAASRSRWIRAALPQPAIRSVAPNLP